MPLGFLVGIGAGFASALLFASASTGTIIGVFVLFFLTPLPVAIAGFGWGWASAAIASIAAAASVAVFGGPRAALFHILALGVPVAVFSYLILLSRPVTVPSATGSDETTTLEWYPLGRIVAWTALWAGVVAALGLLTTSTDVEGLRTALGQTLDRMMSGPALGAGRELTKQEKDAFISLMTLVFPWALSSMWLAIAIVNLWVAGHVTRLSGRLMRPWPDLSSIALPPVMPLAFGGALALTFLPGMPGLVASGFASAFMFAFMLLGLAILHGLTRGMGLRPFILSLVYTSLIFLSPFSSLIVAMIGLAEPFLRLKRPPPDSLLPPR